VLLVEIVQYSSVLRGAAPVANADAGLALACDYWVQRNSNHAACTACAVLSSNNPHLCAPLTLRQCCPEEQCADLARGRIVMKDM
jgi:hypothetical protein